MRRPVAISLLVLLTATFHRPASSCSFSGTVTVNDFVDMSDAVFVGTVVAVAPFVPNTPRELRFSVESVWKGAIRSDHRHFLWASSELYEMSDLVGTTRVVLASQKCGSFDTTPMPCADLALPTQEELTAHLGAPRKPHIVLGNDSVPSALRQYQRMCSYEDEATHFVVLGVAAIVLSAFAAAIVRFLWSRALRRRRREDETHR